MAGIRSQPHLTSEHRRRRRVATVVLVIGVVFTVGWISVVAALAGGNGGADQASGGDGGGGQQQAISPETTAQQTSEEEEPTSEPTTQPKDDSSTTGGEATEDGGQPTVDKTSTESQQQPVAGQEETEGVFDPLEEEPEPDNPAREEHEPEEEAEPADPAQAEPTNQVQEEPERTSDPQQQQQQDDAPTSKEPEPVGLSETGIERAKTAVHRYLSAAYGYTGDSSEAYLEGIEQAASEEIHDSPGGERLEGYAEAAPECGMISTAILDEFRVVGKGPDELDVAVTFSVEDADGQTHQFRQLQRLAVAGGGYEVLAVSVEELISDTTPTESCPGSGSTDQTTGGNGLSTSQRAASEETPEGPEKSTELTETDKEQVRSAADRFITSAYGYSGDSPEDYRDGLAGAALLPDVYNSPGGERLKDYQTAAGKGGIGMAAVMDRFEITGTSSESNQVEGVAYFRVAGSYDQNSELEGETAAFSQELTLTPVNSAYKVSSAELEEPDTDDQSQGGT